MTPNAIASTLSLPSGQFIDGAFTRASAQFVTVDPSTAEELMLFDILFSRERRRARA